MRSFVRPWVCCLANSRGAMFGMDARIAISIFAVLSIVSGFFAFSKVDTARDAALLRELESVHDGLFSYHVDMNNFHMFTIDMSDGARDFEALWDRQMLKPGYHQHWNGPYIQVHSRDHKVYGEFRLRYRQKDFSQSCTRSSNCYVWVELSGVPARMWVDINRYVDESLGETPEPESIKHTMGRVRADGATDPRTLYYRSVSRLGKHAEDG